MKHLKKNGIFLVLILTIILRLVNINQSFWLDEAISALIAKNYSYMGIWDFIKGDNHPPLFYLFLKLWGSFLGFNDMSLRLMPITFGVLTVLVGYLYLKKLFDQKIALLGSLLLATSPLHTYYSQELRMYPVLTFGVICLAYVTNFLLYKKNKLWQWVAFSFCILMVGITDYVGFFFFIALIGFIFLQPIESKQKFKFAVSFLPLGIVMVLMIPILNSQVATIQSQIATLPGWKEMIGGGTYKEAGLLWMKFVLGRISFEPKAGYYLLTGFFSLPVLIALVLSIKRHIKTLQLWIYFIIPLITGFIISFVVPVFNYFRFIYVLPFFYGLLAVGILRLKNRLFRWGLIGFILIGNLIGNGIYFVSHDNQRENWKAAIASVESSDVQLAVFEFPAPFAPFEWYSSGKVEGLGALTNLNSDVRLTEQKIDNEISDEITRISYFVYLRDLTDPARHVETKLESLGFRKVKSEGFPGVGEIVYYER